MVVSGENNLIASIHIVTDLEQIELQWRKLENTAQPDFFLTWSWLGPWARLVIKKTDLYLYQLVSNDKTIAMCFLTFVENKRMKKRIRSRQVHINEYLNDNFDMVIQYNGVLCARADERSAWERLVRSLCQWEEPWDEIALSSIKQGTLELIHQVAAGLKYKLDKSHAIWRVELDQACADKQVLLQLFKGKSRQQLKQSLRAFHETFGELEIKRAGNADEAIKLFHKMEKFHTTRWHNDDLPGSFANNKWVQFHNDLIRKGFLRDEVIMLEVSAGTKEIGYLYGHRLGDTLYMQQTGFRTIKNNNSLRAGYISHLMAMSYAASQGVKYYDFLPDDEGSYKKFFAVANGQVAWARLQRTRIKFKIEDFIRRVFPK